MRTYCAFASYTPKIMHLYRQVHVWKYCRRVLVRGLHSAMHSGTITNMVVSLDGVPTSRYNVHHDKIIFWDRLEPKVEEFKLWIFKWNMKVPATYSVDVKIFFKELEQPRYWEE